MRGYFSSATVRVSFRRLVSISVPLPCPSLTVLVSQIHRRLDEEALRAQNYLAPSTEPLLVSLLEHVLIEQHLQSILGHPSAGLSTLIHDSRIDDLKLMYALFGRVGKGHRALQDGISQWIVRIGQQVNEGLNVAVGAEEGADKGKGKEKEGEAEGAGAAAAGKKKAGEAAGPVNARTKAALGWVQNVLDLKDKFDTLLAKAFSSDKEFEKAINSVRFLPFPGSLFIGGGRLTSFPRVGLLRFRQREPQVARVHLAFHRRKLAQGSQGRTSLPLPSLLSSLLTPSLPPQKTEGEVDEVLNKSVALFRFLTEKDAFEKYYNSHLSKRLIGQRSVSDDAERSMLAKFKIEAGAAFTKSAEGMMKDVKISDDTREEFTRYQQRSSTVRFLPSLLPFFELLLTSSSWQSAPFDMTPIICGSNFWPFSAKEATCALPKVLQDGITSFETFYNQKHSGRKLSFRPEFGSVDVKVKFKARNHELNISTHAMVVLALFEGLGEDEKLNYVVRLFPLSLSLSINGSPSLPHLGHLQLDQHGPRRAQANSANPRLRQVQSPDEEPERSRRQRLGLVLVQQRVYVPVGEDQDCDGGGEGGDGCGEEGDGEQGR